MKELEIKPHEPVVIVAEQKKDKFLFQQEKRQRGHKTFEYDYDTHKIVEAKFKTGSVMITGDGFGRTSTTKVYTIDMRENCAYFQALNYKNAVRKLKATGVPVQDGRSKDITEDSSPSS